MSARRGFGLMEVVFAVAIVSMALLALQATVSGGIKSAGNSVNRRAARELARAKLEEVLAGIEAPETLGGELEDHPGFVLDAQVEEVMIGVPDAAQTESIRIVTVQLRYPITAIRPAGSDDLGAGAGGDEDETETIKLASIMPTDKQQPTGGQPQ